MPLGILWLADTLLNDCLLDEFPENTPPFLVAGVEDNTSAEIRGAAIALDILYRGRKDGERQS